MPKVLLGRPYKHLPLPNFDEIFVILEDFLRNSILTGQILWGHARSDATRLTSPHLSNPRKIFTFLSKPPRKELLLKSNNLLWSFVSLKIKASMLAADQNLLVVAGWIIFSFLRFMGGLFFYHNIRSFHTCHTFSAPVPHLKRAL